MKRTLSLLLATMAVVGVVPFSVEANHPCTDVQPGEPCTVDEDCGEPYTNEYNETAVDCTLADGSTVKCTLHPQEHNGAVVRGCTYPAHVQSAGGLGPGGLIGLATLGVAGLGFAVWRVARHGLPFGVLPLFSRVQRSNALDHPQRQRIHDHVSANPGIRLGDVGTVLDLSNGELRHHVRVLEKAGLLAVTRSADRVTLRVAGTPPVVQLEPPAVEILSVLASQQNVDAEQIRRELHWTRSKTRHWLRRLEAAGAITVKREGRRALLAPASRTEPAAGALGSPAP